MPSFTIRIQVPAGTEGFFPGNHSTHNSAVAAISAGSK